MYNIILKVDIVPVCDLRLLLEACKASGDCEEGKKKPNPNDSILIQALPLFFLQ